MFNPRTKAYLMLLAVATIWGVASPIIKYTLQAFSADVFLAYRYFYATLVAIFLFFVTKNTFPKSISAILLLLLYAFLNSVVSLGFLFFGMENTTVLDMSLITLVTPLVVSAAGVYYLNEKITKREKIGMFIAITGVIITIVEPMYLNGSDILQFSGNLLILGYVLTTTVTTVLSKKLLRMSISPLMLVNSSFIAGFVSFLSYLIWTGNLDLNQIINTPYQFHLGVIYMALISGTLGFWLSTKAQKTIEISEQSLFSYLSPIFSIPIAVIWLGEKITSIFVIGAIIIAIGVGIAEIKRARYNNKV